MLFLNSILILFYGLVLATHHSSLDCMQKEPRLSKHPKLVVISYDGFRFDYLDKANTTVLSALRDRGVYGPYMKSQFVTNTNPNHQSIATGLFSESHGIIDNSVFEPQLDKELDGFDFFNEPFWNFDPQVVPIWIRNEWAGDGRYSGAIWPGSNIPYGSNKSLPTHTMAYEKSMPFENRVDLITSWLLDPETPANLVFMYFDEPEGQGHLYGPDSDQVITAIERMDNLTGYLIDRLKAEKIYDQLDLIILSDHGMHEGSLNHIINISEIVDTSLYSRFGGTPVLHIVPNPGKLEIIYNGFKNGSVGKNFSVYKKDKIPDCWRFKNNRRVTPIVLVADPPNVFDDFPRMVEMFINMYCVDCTDEEKKILAENPDGKFGIHGYSGDIITMRPFFIAHGPSFKKEFQAQPFQNVDLFPLICNMMDIPVPPNNGSMETIKEILNAWPKGNTNGELSLSATQVSILIPWNWDINILFGFVSLLHNRFQ